MKKLGGIMTPYGKIKRNLINIELNNVNQI